MNNLDATLRHPPADVNPTGAGDNLRLLAGLGGAVLGYWLLSWALGLSRTEAAPLFEVITLGVAGVFLLRHLHATSFLEWPAADRLVTVCFAAAIALAAIGVTSPGGHGLVHLVLLVPLAEELFFRGAVQGVTLRAWGYIPAVIATTGLFILLHAPVSLEALVQLLLLSLACCGLRMLRHGLLAAVIAHAAWNLAATTAAADPDLLTNPWVIIPCGAATAAVLIFLARQPLGPPREGQA